MTIGGSSGRRYAGIALLIAGYAILAHYTNSNPRAKGLGAMLALAPPLVVALSLAWRSRHRVAALAGAALAAAMLASNWRMIEANFTLVYLLEDCSIYVLLSATFARTLIRGRVPLCTQWAKLLHGSLAPTVVRYTRSTTLAWAVFFVIICCVSVALYGFAPLRVWSAFVNFFTLPLVVLMFVGEYAVRRKCLPAAQRTGLLQSVRVYLNSSRHPTTQRQ